MGMRQSGATEDFDLQTIRDFLRPDDDGLSYWQKVHSEPVATGELALSGCNSLP